MNTHRSGHAPYRDVTTRRYMGARNRDAHTGKQHGHKRTVQPRGLDGGQEELAAVGVLAGVGHGQDTRASVGQLEVLVRKLLAIDALAARAVMASEVCDTEATAKGRQEPNQQQHARISRTRRTSNHRGLKLARRYTGSPKEPTESHQSTARERPGIPQGLARQCLHHPADHQRINHKRLFTLNVPPPWHMKSVITRWKVEPL